MTSKSFKSAYPGRSNQSLGIVRADNRVRVSVDHGSDGARGIIIAPSDAPALALAILEAAGAHKDSQDFLGGAVEQLKFHIGEQERITAEARELAELEAEALELCNAWRAEGGEKLLERWDAEEGDMIPSKPFWLAVARRAREMRAEK